MAWSLLKTVLCEEAGHFRTCLHLHPIGLATGFRLVHSSSAFQLSGNAIVEWIVLALSISLVTGLSASHVCSHTQEMAAASGSLAILAPVFSDPRDLISDYGLFLLFLLFSEVFLSLVIAAAGTLALCTSDAELTLEQVATMLSGITGKTVPEIRAAGVVDTLHAAELVGMLKNAPALSLLARETKDAYKRQKLEAMIAEMSEPLADEPASVASGAHPLEQPKDVEMVEPADGMNDSLAEEPEAVASGADPLNQPKDVEMLERAESQKSWRMAEAVETSDAASSKGTALNAQDCTWIEHPDVEYTASVLWG